MVVGQNQCMDYTSEDIIFACFSSVLCCDFPSHVYFENVSEKVMAPTVHMITCLCTE